MKIAIFTDAFYPQINGVTTSISSIATNMADRGHDILIFAPKYKNLKEFSYPGVRIFRLPSLPASFYQDFRWTSPFSFSTYKILKRENVDLIHFMTPVFISYVGIKYSRKLNIPLIGTFHTFVADPSYYEHLFDGPIKATEEVSWKYLNLYYDSADYVTAPTEEAVKIIKQHGCKAPMEAISNGIDGAIFDDSGREAFKQKYGLKDNVLLYIGRIAHEKNILKLIDAFDIVYKENPKSQLLLIGDGPQLEEFKSYGEGKASSQGIIFAGAITHDKLIHSGVFKLASLFVSLSKTETQGITFLEAQINGLIPIGASEGGVKNLIKDGVNGYFADPNSPSDIAEKILYVLDNKQELNTIKNNAIKMVEEHKMSHVIDRWEDLYRDLYQKYYSGELPRPKTISMAAIAKIGSMFKIDPLFLAKKVRGLYRKE